MRKIREAFLISKTELARKAGGLLLTVDRIEKEDNRRAKIQEKNHACPGI